MSNILDTMHFHGLPELLLGSRARVAVLKALLAAPGTEWTGRELARKASVSPTQALKALRAFEAEGLCRQRRVGRSSVWHVVEAHFAVRRLRAALTLDEEAQRRLRVHLEKALEGSGALEAYVFGSVAERRESASSDIDLLVLFRDLRSLEAWGPKLERARQAVLRDFASFLSPSLLTVSQVKTPARRNLLAQARAKGNPLEVGK